MFKQFMIYEVEEVEFQVVEHAPRTLEVTITDANILVAMSHDQFKQHFSILTSTPLIEIINVYNYGDIKIWYVTLASNRRYEQSHVIINRTSDISRYT